MAKVKSGVQMQVHQEMIDFKKKIKTERIKKGKEEYAQLSDKRLSRTFVKILSLPQNYNLLISCDIDLEKE